MSLLLLARCGAAPQSQASAAQQQDGLLAADPNDYCADMNDWPPSSTSLEDTVLERVNALRAVGARCGPQVFEPTAPLLNTPALRCAARRHALDMATRKFYGHTNPDGQTPWDRLHMAGAIYSYATENLGAGSPTVNGMLAQWMNRVDSCANIMNPKLSELGVGFAANPQSPYRYYWTQTFAAP